MKCQSKISRFCEKNIKGRIKWYDKKRCCRYCYYKLKENGKKNV